MRALALTVTLGLLMLVLSCVPNYGKPYRPAPVWTDARLVLLARDMTEQDYTVKDDNPVLVEEVGKVYHKMRQSISWEPPDPSFFVIKEPFIRLLPDGRLEIGEPFLAPLRDEAMVAALIAHMISHIVYGHLNAILEYNYPREIFTLWGEGSPSIWQEQSDKLKQALKQGYPADWEREASEGAIVMMITAGYDPAAAAEAWEILNQNANKAVRNSAVMHHLDSEETRRFWEKNRYDVTEPIGGWIREREVWQDALSGIKTLLKPINP
jgi:hypothetical protein